MFHSIGIGEDMIEYIESVKSMAIPHIGKRKAMKIAKKAIKADTSSFNICDTKPANINVYNLLKEPCWFIFVPWNDGKDGMMHRSSHLLLISKLTGRVLFDGSAGDEG